MENEGATGDIRLLYICITYYPTVSVNCSPNMKLPERTLIPVRLQGRHDVIAFHYAAHASFQQVLGETRQIVGGMAEKVVRGW